MNLPVKTIVVHSSDSPHRGDTAEDVHRWHSPPEGEFSGIGYHYIIQEDGTVQTGRPEYWAGAHVRGHNVNTLGIMLFGENGYFTEAQYSSLICIIRGILHRHDTVENICGHYQLDSRKTCPDIDMPSWLESVGLGEYAINV